MRIEMKLRYRLFRRSNGLFFIEDTVTKKQESLRTREKAIAQRLLNARNEAYQQPAINLQIARAYLRASDPLISQRTWQHALEEIIKSKRGANQDRWFRAAKDKAYDSIKGIALIETQAEHLLKVLQIGTVSTNVFLRKLHNFCVDMNWLPWPIVPKRQPCHRLRQTFSSSRLSCGVRSPLRLRPFGSGVAVGERTILTAAHMMFDDENLSFVDGDKVYWFFQKQAGGFDPKPQTPRGWYMLSSYSAARTNDLLINTNLYSPGVSSAESRSHDVAVLYFQSPAARGGYGGYLSSDSVPNEWLSSSLPKMLVGYPLDGTVAGSTNIIGGQMHATQTNNYTFTQELTNNVYLTTGFLSFAGNSGGPVYVLNTNSIYYPAGVYLGTVGNASAVRAIDSNVVNLITLAEDAGRNGDSGTNFTGGGVFRIVSSAPGGGGGSLQVHIGPTNALQAGGGWRVVGQSSYQNNPNATAWFTTATAEIEFAEVPGWASPTNRTVSIPQGVTIIEAIYLATMQVNLGPSSAMAAGGGWRLAGETNYVQQTNASRVITNNITTTIEFAPVDKWVAPSTQTVTLLTNQPLVITTNYLAKMQVNLGPSAALVAGGGWRLAGDTNYIQGSNGYQVITSNRPVVIEFASADHWVAPSPFTTNLVVGQPVVITTNYVVTNPTLKALPSGLSMSGATNTTYKIEYTTNLAGGQWSALQTNTINSTGFNLLIPFPPTNNIPATFYRAVWSP
jgi:hypothetical protein